MIDTTKNLWKALAITLIIGILIVIGLFFLERFGVIKYDAGYKTGVNQTSIAVYQSLKNVAFNCQSFPITNERNITRNLIAYECLQRGNQTR